MLMSVCLRKELQRELCEHFHDMDFILNDTIATHEQYHIIALHGQTAYFHFSLW